MILFWVWRLKAYFSLVSLKQCNFLALDMKCALDVLVKCQACYLPSRWLTLIHNWLNFCNWLTLIMMWLLIILWVQCISTCRLNKANCAMTFSCVCTSHCWLANAWQNKSLTTWWSSKCHLLNHGSFDKTINIISLTPPPSYTSTFGNQLFHVMCTREGLGRVELRLAFPSHLPQYSVYSLSDWSKPMLKICKGCVCKVLLQSQKLNKKQSMTSMKILESEQ